MMGKKVLAAKSGRTACPCAAAGGDGCSVGVFNAERQSSREAKSFLTGLTGFTGLREASVKPAKTKPSGVAWIGDVPEGWGIGRVKNSFYHIKEVVKERAAEFDRLALTLQGVIKRPKEDTNGLQPKEFEGYQVLRKNELVFKLIDLQNISTSRVGRSSYDGIVSPAYIILHSRDNSSTAFACYYFLSMWMHNIFQTLGGDAVRSCLNASDLLNVPLLRPPLPVQRAITAYLDEKCGAIDVAIAEAKKGIEEYKAWKKSLIFEVVTGKRRIGVFNAESKCARDEVVGLPERSEPEGLQGAARRRVAEKMKSSGIPWIGTIPEGWKVSRVKNECDCLDYLREPISAENRVNEKALYDYYGASGAIDKIDDFNVDDTVLLIGEDGANLRMRNLPLVYRASGKIWVNNHAHILKVKPSNDYGFMAYALEAGDYNDFVTGSAQPKLTQTDLMAMPVVLPSLPEQRAIADYLDDKCAAIDKMVAEKNALIADLEAYKKSLIYEIVTGKREVSNINERKKRGPF